MEKKVQDDINYLFDNKFLITISKYENLRQYDKIVTMITLKRASFMGNLKRARARGTMSIGKIRMFTKMFKKLNNVKEHFENLAKD